MDRRAARRVGSVGALLALTVWMGGLPAAVADEPVRDTPTAAAPAVPVLEEPAADATPSPEPSPSPSVEPSSPDGQPTPAAEPTPTPSPESSSPGAGTGEEPQHAGPASEPTPTHVDAPPPTSGDEEPTGQPSAAAGSAPTETSRAGLEAAAPASTIAIGDFDCTSLTVEVGLDNTLESSPTDFVVQVQRYDWNTGYTLVSRQELRLGPHESQTVTVALLPDAYTRVHVGSSRGETRIKGGACGTYLYDPRATIESLDCSTLTSAIRLDNSRSTDTVTFLVQVFAAGGPDPTRSPSTFRVTAGEVRDVEVPLDDYAVVTVVVTSYLWPGSTELARGETTCGYVSRAAIDAFDCGSLTATAHLENGSATVATVFHVRSATRDETLMDDDVEVPPGATTSISIPLGDDTEDSVSITGPGGWLLAEERAVCGEMVIAPRAVIGDTDCRTLTVPVTLDNSASTVDVTYSVYWRPLASDEDDDSRDEHVGAGEIRHVRLPIEDSAFYLVSVSARDSELATSPPLARSTSTGGCGLITVSPVDCVAGTVDVTFRNTNAHFGGQLFVVHSARYPQHPSAFHTVVLVAPGATTVVTVPLKELDGGPIVIDQPGDTWFSSVATIPVGEACSPGVTPNTRPGAAATSGTEVLAATGADGLPQLVLGGLLMLVLGGVLLRVGHGPGTSPGAGARTTTAVSVERRAA